MRRLYIYILALPLLLSPNFEVYAHDTAWGKRQQKNTQNNQTRSHQTGTANQLFSKIRAANSKANMVNERALRQALCYLTNNSNRFRNKDYMTIVDYNQPNTSKRLYLINLRTGKIERHTVAHGAGSDPNRSGYAKRFGNRSGSHQTPLGFMRVAEPYSGKHGLSLRMDGLESINSNSRRRAIVMHQASYVTNNRAGRSWGCFVVSKPVRSQIFKKVDGGSLLYSYHNSLRSGPCR